MAFLVKRYQDVFYIVDKSRGKVKWRKLGRIPAREAKKALGKYLSDETYLRLGYLDDSSINFDDLVKEYLEDARRHKGAYTVEVESSHFPKMLKEWGKRKAREITATEVELYLHSKNYKPTTIKNKLILLSNVWAYGIRQGYFKENEMKKCRRPELEQLPPVIVSEESINAIIKKTIPRIRPILEILRYTACRPSEALKLQAKDIDLKAKTILFRHTKTKRSRVVPMAKKLIPVLIYVLNGKKGEDFLFQEDKRSLRYAFEEAKTTAGVKERVFLYAFRHFALTKFLEITNGDLRATQQLAGHSQIQTTIRYTSRPPNIIKKAVDKL